MWSFCRCRKTLSSRNGVVTTYSNDAKNQLLGQTVAGGCATFAYDAVGNETLKWHQGQAPMTMTFDAASRQVTMIYGGATTLYTYNQAGAKTAENLGGAITGFVYDGENRCLKVTLPDFSIVTNTYSGDGLRRTYQDPGKHVFTQIWDGTDYLGEVQ